jgi:outer membrane protein assembly factor BamB
MSEVTALLERTRRRVHSAPGSFDRLLERRDRKRRRHRIAAAVVALLVAVAGSAGLLLALREEPRPATPSPTQIDASDVRELGPTWSAVLDGPAASLGNRLSAHEPFAPTIDGNTVVVGTEAGTVSVFPSACGRMTCEPLWTSGLGEPIAFAPSVANGMIYVATDQGGVYGFEADCSTHTCSPRWTAHIDTTLASAPVIGDGFVYGIGALDSTLYAFPRSCDGPCKPAWTASLGPAADRSRDNSFLTDEVEVLPLVDGHIVYAVSFTDHTLRAFDATSGRLLWTGAPTEPVRGGVRFNGPVLAGDEVVIEAGTRLYAFASDCGSHGEACIPDWITASMDDFVGKPVIAGDRLFVGTAINGNLGYVSAFHVDCRTDGDTCSPLWRTRIGGEPTEEPLTVASGHVVAVSNYANLIASVPTSCDHDPCDVEWQVQGITEPAAATVVSDLVFVNTATGRLSAFPLSCRDECRPVWTTQQGDAVSPPAVSGSRFFVATSGGDLVAFAPAQAQPASASGSGTAPVGISIAAAAALIAVAAIWFSRRHRA